MSDTHERDPGLDPESVANLEGGLTTDAIAQLNNPPEEKTPVAVKRDGKIRVVGPEFFPV